MVKFENKPKASEINNCPDIELPKTSSNKFNSTKNGIKSITPFVNEVTNFTDCKLKSVGYFIKTSESAAILCTH